MDMKKLNLQLFAEGAAEAASGGENGADAAHDDGRETVVYGKQARDDDGDTEEEGDAPEEEAPKRASFDELIKGEYKEDFTKKMQQVINRRFAETKSLNERLDRVNPILDMVASRYGLRPDDTQGLLRALEDDETYYEEEAVSRGMSVEQLKQIKRMENENRRLREQVDHMHQQEETDRIYRGWISEAETLKDTYPGFDFNEEIQNEDFASLLKNGIDVRTAYEVVHKDEIITGAMQVTARRVREKVANDIMSNGKRAVEGSTGGSGVIAKSDVNKLSKADREEIEKRVMRGEKITF